MKKIIPILGIIIAILIMIWIPKSTRKENTIRLGEVTHSIFYAPLYVAIENNYFQEEDINLEITTISGADKVAAAVLSNTIDIGFAGLEATMYIYEENTEDYLVNFSGLTKRDGQFILSKTKDFNWKDLEGKEILIGRLGGMPAINFIKALENEGVDISKVKLNTSVEFQNLSAAYISGTGDYVNLFEPNATKLEQNGYGYIVKSIGSSVGELPYTTFFTKKSFLENNTSLIHSFRNAIQKGLTYVLEHSSKEIATLIQPQFEDLSIEELENMITNYKENDCWLENTTITEESFHNLETLLKENNLIQESIPYKDLVVNE